MNIITAKYIFDGNNLLENKAIIIEKGIITQIIPDIGLTNTTLKNYGDCIITPGFIDLQLNGCGGVLFNDDISLNTLETMYLTCLKYGTTGFLPTLITCEFSDVIKALEVLKTWFSQYKNSRGVLGVHLEGPFISPEKNGIHPKQFIIPPTNEYLKKIVTYNKYFPIKMTIAVEKFSHDQIKFLLDNDVILSIGHSNASYEQVTQAINLGLQCATHTFNAMSGLTGRSPGVIGGILNNDIYNGIIADMLHVDKANIQLLAKLKPEHTFLVTDAVTPMGTTNITEFELGGTTLFVKDGKCTNQDGVLGGAILTMPKAVANCVSICQIDLAQALKMASQIPAKLLGYDRSIGKIATGYRADLITFDLQTHECQVLEF